jgi:hypothetical protein
MTTEYTVRMDRQTAHRLLDALDRTAKAPVTLLRARFTSREARLHLRLTEEKDGLLVLELLKSAGAVDPSPEKRKRSRSLAS